MKGSCSQGVVRPTGNNQNGVPDPLPRCGPGHFAEGCERFLDLLDEHFVRVFAGEGHFSSMPHFASFAADIPVGAGALDVFDFGVLSLVAMKRVYLPGAAGFGARRRKLRHWAFGFAGGTGPYSVRWA